MNHAIHQFLNAASPATNIAPPASTAIQILPFKQLEWGHFERLCVRQALKNALVEDVRQFGTPGQDQEGIDIYIAKSDGSYEVWQCKRYQRFRPQLIQSAAKHFLEGEWAKKAATFRLCVTDDLTSVEHCKAIEQTRDLLRAEGIAFIPMGINELSSALKEHPDLVSDFFGKAWVDLFCRTELANAALPKEPDPDPVEEVLLSNLLKVETIPCRIWFGPTACRKDTDIYSAVDRPDVFLLRDEKLYSFSNISCTACLLHPFVDATAIGHLDADDWLDDPVRSKWFTEMLNKSLRQHLHSKGLRRAKGHRYFFLPSKDGTNRSSTSYGTRAIRLAHKADKFWVHRSATLQFQQIGRGHYLLVEPGFMFTTDGFKPIGGIEATKKAMQWGGRQQNDDVLRSVLFWVRVLSCGTGAIRIDAGAEHICVRAAAASAKLPWGIRNDHIHMSVLMTELDHRPDEMEDAVAAAAKGFDSEGEYEDEEHYEHSTAD